MKVALIGITGHVGSRVVNELLRRGHKVLGLARHPPDVVSQLNLTVAQSDATMPSQLSPAMRKLLLEMIIPITHVE